MSDNKALWKRAFTTDPRAVKAITGKQYSGNSPKPYWIVERLTEEFGPCGIGWGFTILNERFERFSDTDSLHVAVVRFWYVMDGVRGELEQVGQTKATYTTSKGTFLLDEDAPKKSVTDALVKCASYLGFAGDIFSGRWDDSKYVAEAAKLYREKDAEGAKPPPDVAHSATAIAYAKLSPDMQAWVTMQAGKISDTFEQQGVAEAWELFSRVKLDEQLGPDEIAGLWGKIDSKARTNMKKHADAQKKPAEATT